MRLPVTPVLAALVACTVSPARADANEECRRGADQALQRAQAMPHDDLSRRFAEVDIASALTEMHAGEVEDCPELLARANEAMTTRPYALRPGERLLEHRSSPHR